MITVSGRGTNCPSTWSAGEVTKGRKTLWAYYEMKQKSAFVLVFICCRQFWILFDVQFCRAVQGRQTRAPVVVTSQTHCNPLKSCCKQCQISFARLLYRVSALLVLKIAWLFFFSANISWKAFKWENVTILATIDVLSLVYSRCSSTSNVQKREEKSRTLNIIKQAYLWNISTLLVVSWNF